MNSYLLFLGALTQALYMVRLNRFDVTKCLLIFGLPSLLFLPLILLPFSQKIVFYTVLSMTLFIYVFIKRLMPVVSKQIIILQSCTLVYTIAVISTSQLFLVLLGLLALSILVFTFTLYNKPLSLFNRIVLYVLFVIQMVSQVIVLFFYTRWSTTIISFDTLSTVDAVLIGMSISYALSVLLSARVILFNKQAVKEFAISKFVDTNTFSWYAMMVLVIFQISTYVLNYMFAFIGHFTLINIWVLFLPNVIIGLDKLKYLSKE